MMRFYRLKKNETAILQKKIVFFKKMIKKVT
jgi:hypothetical protein